MRALAWPPERPDDPGGRTTGTGKTLMASEEVVGGYEFGGLMARVEDAVRRLGAKRVAFDSLGAVFSRFADPTVVRAELRRVAAGLSALEVTSLLTAERTEEYGPISRSSVEEYVHDRRPRDAHRWAPALVER